jgi:hypothetical protein
MRTVFLLTGFNNWGKTTLIKSLFGKKAFKKNIPHIYSGKKFCVIPQSNDDLGELGYTKAYNDRISTAKGSWGNPEYIFSAFCPTKEPQNQSSRIISSIYPNDNVYLLPIVYKWCSHSKLILPEIESYFSKNKNVKVHPITSKALGRTKLSELKRVTNSLL